MEYADAKVGSKVVFATETMCGEVGAGDALIGSGATGEIVRIDGDEKGIDVYVRLNDDALTGELVFMSTWAGHELDNLRVA